MDVCNILVFQNLLSFLKLCVFVHVHMYMNRILFGAICSYTIFENVSMQHTYVSQWIEHNNFHSFLNPHERIPSTIFTLMCQDERMSTIDRERASESKNIK